MDSTFNTEDSGYHQIRQCGPSWEYCTGLCNMCKKQNLIYTNKTTNIQYPYTYTNYTIPNNERG